MDSLAKEMCNLNIAFEYLELGEKAPPGWFKASEHIVFDVKMDFTWKARWVKDGHKTPPDSQLQALPVFYLMRVLELG